MATDMKGNDGEVYNMNVCGVVDLDRFQLGSKQSMQKHTLSLVSTTPPSLRGSIEQEPTVSVFQHQ